MAYYRVGGTTVRRMGDYPAAGMYESLVESRSLATALEEAEIIVPRSSRWGLSCAERMRRRVDRAAWASMTHVGSTYLRLRLRYERATNLPQSLRLRCRTAPTPFLRRLWSWVMRQKSFVKMFR